MLQSLNILENTRHRVVIPGWDGIEFVIVTAGTSDRLRQKTSSDDVELFIDEIHLELALVLVFKIGVPHHKERCGHEILPLCLECCCLK